MYLSTGVQRFGDARSQVMDYMPQDSSTDPSSEKYTYSVYMHQVLYAGLAYYNTDPHSHISLRDRERRIQKLSNLISSGTSLDIQPLLGSLLLLVKRLQKDYLKEMAEADPMQHLVQAMRHCISSPRVLSTACLLVSVFVWKESPPDDSDLPQCASTELEDAQGSEIKDGLLQQFLECRGPDTVMEKLSSHVFSAHDTYIIVSTLLPIMILASRVEGRAWLEQNSGHLSFYKELLTRNKAFITHINLSNHLGRGLQVGQVIKTFLTFVEEIEAKDREQNLAELLEEEERDRLKRERKKRKRQKKHNKQSKTESAPQVAVADVSTDDENDRGTGWTADLCSRTSEVLPQITNSSVDKEQTQLYYQSKPQPQFSMQHKDKVPLLQGSRQTSNTIGKTFPSEACMASDKLPDKDAKWRQPVTVPDEFPPISAGSEDRVASAGNDGWVKVESRKQGCKGTCKQTTPLPLSTRPPRKQELPRPAPMRWADVAKIGCARDAGTRNFTVLLGDVGRSTASEYYKMSVLSKNNTSQPMQCPEQGETRARFERDGEDWQQIARNAFADSMASKHQDEDSEFVSHTSVSSESDSDEVSSTTSSECPCGQSDGLQIRKKSLSVVDDFESIDPYIIKDLPSSKSDYYAFTGGYLNYLDDHKESKPFTFDDAGNLESKWKCFDVDVDKIISSQRASGDTNHHSNEGKLPETSWTRTDAKPNLTFPQAWDLTCRTKSLEDLDVTGSQLSDEHSVLGCSDPFDESKFLSSTSFTRTKTPPTRGERDMTDDTMASLRLSSAFGSSNPYINIQQGSSLLKKINVLPEKQPTVPFTNSMEKYLSVPNEMTGQWVPDKQGMMQADVERNPWLVKDAKQKYVAAGSNIPCWRDELNLDNATQQQSFRSFIPSFASMTSALDNNPIVTSVVESVLTPTVSSLGNLATAGRLPTYSSSRMRDVPSPPPGFKFQKPSMHIAGFDLALLNSQEASTGKTQSSSANTVLNNGECHQDGTTMSCSNGDFDPSSLSEKQQLPLGQARTRATMVGVVGPFSKTTIGPDDILELSHQQQFEQQQQYQQLQLQHRQQQQQQHQLFQAHPGVVAPSPTPGAVPSTNNEPRAQDGNIYGLPMTFSRVMAGLSGNNGGWPDRTRSAMSTVIASGISQLPASSRGSNTGEFSAILSGRLQQRETLRHQDGQQVPLKRYPQSYPDIQLRSFSDVVDGCPRRCGDQVLLQPQQQQQQQQQHQLQQQRLQQHQQYCTLPAQHLLQQALKPNKLGALPYKQQASGLVHSSRAVHQPLQRLPSPPVLFPSHLRDEPEPRPGSKSNFPSFHDSTGSDLLSDLFADPFLVEKIAINQIRQQFLATHASYLLRDSAMSALRDSVYCNDLDYYASLYRVKLKDLLVGPVQPDLCNPEATLAERVSGVTSRPEHEKLGSQCPRTPGTVDGRCVSPERDTGHDRSSRRWRDALNKILEIPWTMRRQYGDIVLPNTLAPYNITHVEYPLVLGFTTDGCEVAVLILEKTLAYIDPFLLDLMCDPELDHHFILKCKGVAETCTHEYVALDLCDYTLAEYVQIVQLSHRQDPLSANRLAWQLLEGLRFIHQNLRMPHGNLKPSWVFVDSEGRLRLGGYGIVARQTSSLGGGLGSTVDRTEIGRAACWTASEDLNNDQAQPSMASDIQVAGMLLYFILTGGQHPFGATPLEAEVNIARNSSHMTHISEEANDLVSGMLFPDSSARPTIEHCLKHPFFWSNEKKFRLILIVGSDVLTEMKTGIALTGNGSPTMMEILSLLDISEVSPNWVQAINPTVMKEMRSFRVYKNSLSELTLFIYNCCLHFDKMSTIAKEVLDDPCKYFQTLFPSLFMAIYRSLKASDRTDRTCYKPFFS